MPAWAERPAARQLRNMLTIKQSQCQRAGQFYGGAGATTVGRPLLEANKYSVRGCS